MTPKITLFNNKNSHPTETIKKMTKKQKKGILRALLEKKWN